MFRAYNMKDKHFTNTLSIYIYYKKKSNSLDFRPELFRGDTPDEAALAICCSCAIDSEMPENFIFTPSSSSSSPALY